LKKRTLKKLSLDCCNKTAFSFDEQIYVQKDGVSMGSSLGPVLANIILTEFERLIVSELIADGTIKFYKRYVDDTLVLIKPSNISAVLAKYNSFDPNLNFT
jgi:predicted phosphoribosyltransferase